MAAPPPKPKNDLAEAQRLLRFALLGSKVVRKTQADYPEDAPKVEKFIRDTIATLAPNAFVHVAPQEYEDGTTIDADVYAIRNKEGAWYIKFCMKNGRVTILSCHKPLWPLTRIDGRTILP